MTLHLNDKWVWDFWFAQDGADTHIFYLQAPRALKDPDQRHWHSSIGHAVSQDLFHWEILPDALKPAENADAWDGLTTWTGSTFQHNKRWYLFYTGTSRSDDGHVQRIGLATSEDLVNWQKYSDNPMINIDPQWYEVFDEAVWYEQTWRDPWIFELNETFYALITARSNKGEPSGRGVIGLARSKDLLHWDVLPPITDPGAFAYLEVPQLLKINQRWYLLFCVERDRYANQHLAKKGDRAVTGTHYKFADQPLGPFRQLEYDVLHGDRKGKTYSGKLVKDQTGAWKFMAAIQYDNLGQYVGDISDPMPIEIHEDGSLIVVS